MSEKERPPLQLAFGKERLENVWFFPEGTVIWPEKGGRGVVQKGLYAERLIKREIRGLSGFRSLEDCVLYFGGNYWTLRKNSFFGAYVKNGEKIGLK
jgi:hypothetical protein